MIKAMMVYWFIGNDWVYCRSEADDV